MNRDELVALARDVLDAVEPLIRADERERVEQMARSAVRAEARAVEELTIEVADAWAEGYVAGESAMQGQIEQGRAGLRAKVEALASPDPEYNNAIGDVLALFDGGSDD